MEALDRLGRDGFPASSGHPAGQLQVQVCCRTAAGLLQDLHQGHVSSSLGRDTYRLQELESSTSAFAQTYSSYDGARRRIPPHRRPDGSRLTSSLEEDSSGIYPTASSPLLHQGHVSSTNNLHQGLTHVQTTSTRDTYRRWVCSNCKNWTRRSPRRIPPGRRRRLTSVWRRTAAASDKWWRRWHQHPVQHNRSDPTVNTVYNSRPPGNPAPPACRVWKSWRGWRAT